MAMKNVLIDAHVLGDNSGGNETYYKNLIENILDRNSDSLNFNVFYSTEKKKVVYESLFPESSHFLFLINNPFLRNFIFLNYYCVKHKIDLLHVQYFAPIVKNCLLVSTIHDLSFEYYPECFTKKALMLNRILIPYTAKISDKIITVSNYSKSDIVNRYKIDSNKVVVTYNGVDKKFKRLKNYMENKSYINDKYNIPKDYILVVGNLQPRKNISRLLNVYIQLKKNIEGFDHKLLIVGRKAWLFNDIFKNIRDNGLVDDVILTNFVTDEELVKIYNAADVFVYPSIFEGFGLPPLEAMACGTPVITSNTSSLPEVVGESGIMFNPFNEQEIYDQLKKVLFDKDLKSQLSEYGEIRAKHFSWENTAKNTIQVYQELLSLKNRI
jgi:glycosyltransferase involved in cell wall biosynthesis